jgi:hypothetical protein
MRGLRRRQDSTKSRELESFQAMMAEQKRSLAALAARLRDEPAVAAAGEGAEAEAAPEQEKGRGQGQEGLDTGQVRGRGERSGAGWGSTL